VISYGPNRVPDARAISAPIGRLYPHHELGTVRNSTWAAANEIPGGVSATLT